MALVIDCQTVTIQKIESMLNHKKKWDLVLLLVSKKVCPSLVFKPNLLANMPVIKVIQCPRRMDRFAFVMGYLSGTFKDDDLYLMSGASKSTLDAIISDEFTIHIVRDENEVDGDSENEEKADSDEEEEEEEEQPRPDLADPSSANDLIIKSLFQFVTTREGQNLLKTALEATAGSPEKKE